MAYQCLDCGNRSSRKFPGGKCPACASYNVQSRADKFSYTPEKPRKTLLEIVLLILLWGALAYGVWDRYLQDGLMPESASPVVEEAEQTSETLDQNL